MIDIVERVKRANYKKWHIFANEGSHALKRMEERNLNMIDVKNIIKSGEILPNADSRVVLCVGKKGQEFYTLVLQPLFEAKAWSLWTPRQSNIDEKRKCKESKRQKKVKV